MKRGRPFAPGNKLGRGRPPGSGNKKSLVAQELVDTHAEPVVRKALVLALQGDPQMLRTLLGYILPRPKDPPVKTGPLRMGTVEELAQTFASILKKTSSGQLQLSDTQAIAALIETRRRIIETHELASLMGELERLCQQDK